MLIVFLGLVQICSAATAGGIAGLMSLDDLPADLSQMTAAQFNAYLIYKEIKTQKNQTRGFVHIPELVGPEDLITGIEKGEISDPKRIEEIVKSMYFIHEWAKKYGETKRTKFGKRLLNHVLETKDTDLLITIFNAAIESEFTYYTLGDKKLYEDYLDGVIRTSSALSIKILVYYLDVFPDKLRESEFFPSLIEEVKECDAEISELAVAQKCDKRKKPLTHYRSEVDILIRAMETQKKDPMTIMTEPCNCSGCKNAGEQEEKIVPVSRCEAPLFKKTQEFIETHAILFANAIHEGMMHLHNDPVLSDFYTILANKVATYYQMEETVDVEFATQFLARFSIFSILPVIMMPRNNFLPDVSRHMVFMNQTVLKIAQIESDKKGNWFWEDTGIEYTRNGVYRESWEECHRLMRDSTRYLIPYELQHDDESETGILFRDIRTRYF